MFYCKIHFLLSIENEKGTKMAKKKESSKETIWRLEAQIVALQNAASEQTSALNLQNQKVKSQGERIKELLDDLEEDEVEISDLKAKVSALQKLVDRLQKDKNYLIEHSGRMGQMVLEK